jgi:lipoyl(octanoyl) transferase
MQATQSTPLCDVRWLGRVAYDEAWQIQRDLARRRASDDIPDTLLLLEHDPVYTTGRTDTESNLRVSPAHLGAPIIRSDRGGDITFHGPGQLIAYPILGLKATGLGVASYVRVLEQITIDTLGGYGIEANLECGLTGVWVGTEKIAAIGVRVGRPLGREGTWVTSHGLALNVSVDLAWFERIVPCGLPDRGVTSIAELMPDAPAVQAVGIELSRRFARALGRDISS